MIDPITQVMIDYRKFLRRGGRRVTLPPQQRSGSKGIMYMSGVGPGLCARKSTYQAEVSAGVRKPDFQPEDIDDLMHVSGDLIADFLAEALLWQGSLAGYEVSVKWPHAKPDYTGRIDFLVDADKLPGVVEEWELQPKTLLVGDTKTAMGYDLAKHPKRWYIGQVRMYIKALEDSGMAEAKGFKHLVPVVYQTLRTKQTEGFLCTWNWTDEGNCNLMQFGYSVPRKVFFNLGDDLQAAASAAIRWRKKAEQFGWVVGERYRPARVADRPELHDPNGDKTEKAFICAGQMWKNKRPVKGRFEVSCPFFHTCWQTGGGFMQFGWNTIRDPELDDSDVPF